VIRLASHTAYDITYHFTFIPKYRRRKLTGKIKTRLEGMIRFCAQVNRFDIQELNIQPDHVHVVLTANPSYSPAQIMQLMKGGTSNKLRKLFPELIETIWSTSFWSEGYFVGTVGNRDLATILEYVRNQ